MIVKNILLFQLTNMITWNDVIAAITSDDYITILRRKTQFTHI